MTVIVDELETPVPGTVTVTCTCPPGGSAVTRPVVPTVATPVLLLAQVNVSDS
jgi:hypothetical protein